MTDNQKLDEIISLINFLQHHIQNYVDQSFTDLTFNLETVIKDYLSVFEVGTGVYTNINSIKHNYPAIDLINKKGTAIQVTTTASLTKVKKTVETYKKHNFTYSTLIIIGFVKSTGAKVPGIIVHGIEYLIDLAKHGTFEQKDTIHDILKRQIPLNILNPLADKICFDVVFDVVNRSAVRDYTACEGNFDNMVSGLSEIKEIITTGNIKGKSIRAKALVEYTDDVRRRLSSIEFMISEIIQICNSNKFDNSYNFLCLTRAETEKIDILKEKIIFETNKLSNYFELDKSIIGSRKW